MGGSPDEKAQAGELLETSPFAGDLDGELADRPRRRLSTLTLVLGAGVTLVAGVILGIQAQKALGGPGGQGVMSGDPAAATRQGGTGPGGSGGYGGRQWGGQGTQGTQGGRGTQGSQGGQGGMTFGTVQRVDGGKVYVRQQDGTVVTVNTTGETTVRVTKQGEVTDLKTGGTVVVQGTKDGDGSVTATTINEGGGRR